MRKLSWLALALVAALLAAGAAIAHRSDNKGISSVSTTFSATPTADTRTRTCKDASGAVWHLTHGVYQGTATGQLQGAITIRTESTINTTTGYGYTQGKVLLRDSSSNRLIGEANLDAVNTNSGSLQGLLRGRLNTAAQSGMLLANFTATFASDGSSLSGSVGSGSATNSAIVFGGLPKCSQSSTAPPKPILHLHATVSTASSTSLTVSAGAKSYTIAVPASLSATVSALKPGNRVELTAAYINGAYTLVTLGTGH